VKSEIKEGATQPVKQYLIGNDERRKTIPSNGTNQKPKGLEEWARGYHCCQRNGPFDRPQMDLMADLGAFFCPCVQLWTLGEETPE